MNKEEILTRIRNSPALVALVPNTEAIAVELCKEKYSSQYFIGKGGILEQLGFSVGNAVCDLIDSHPNYRHVKHLLSDGRLDMNVNLTRASISALVDVELAPGITFTAANRDSLLNLSLKNYYVSEYQVRCAIYNDDGSLAL